MGISEKNGPHHPLLKKGKHAHTNPTTCLALLLFTLLTSVIYPFSLTGIAQVLSLEKAYGSLIVKNRTSVGSELIEQYSIS